MLLLLHAADEEFNLIKRSSGRRQPFISPMNHDDDDHRSRMMLMEGDFALGSVIIAWSSTDLFYQLHPYEQIAAIIRLYLNTRNKMTDSRKAGRSNVSAAF